MIEVDEIGRLAAEARALPPEELNARAAAHAAKYPRSASSTWTVRPYKVTSDGREVYGDAELEAAREEAFHREDYAAHNRLAQEQEALLNRRLARAEARRHMQPRTLRATSAHTRPRSRQRRATRNAGRASPTSDGESASREVVAARGAA